MKNIVYCAFSIPVTELVGDKTISNILIVLLCMLLIGGLIWL